MRTFLIRTGAFLLYILLVVCVLQALISFRIRAKTVRGHDNLELTSHVNADVVFLGSSRCWDHFDPNFFDSAYRLRSVNIGVDGHSEISAARVRLRTYLLTNKAPRVAIFSFDPFMHAGSLTDNENFTHKDDFARYAFLPTKDDGLMVDYFRFDRLERYVPLYAIFKYHLLLDAMLLNNYSSWVKYGYERHDEIWDTTRIPVRDEDKVRDYFTVPETTEVAQALDSLNRLCRQNNIKLLCIQTPVYKSVYNDTLFGETNRICQRLGIPFVDADTEDIRDDFDCFCNCNHLNTVGVAKFNTFLSRDSLFNNIMRN